MKIYMENTHIHMLDFMSPCEHRVHLIESLDDSATVILFTS